MCWRKRHRLTGKGAGLLEMAGLAQKGGGRAHPLRFANRPRHQAPFAWGNGEADALMGGTCCPLPHKGDTGPDARWAAGAVVNSHPDHHGGISRDY